MSITRSHVVLLFLFVLAFVIRIWFVSGNNLVFFWDQARDAFVAREIFEQGDLKILGPSASGTKDMVYHGVFYYYVIAPIYSLSGGNPLTVAVWLSFLNSIGVIACYFAGKAIFKSVRVGLVAALLFAISGYSVLFGVWLSNPTFAPVTILLFYLFLWKGFFEYQYRWIPWSALFLGLSIQSAVFTAYLGIAVLVGIVWVLVSKRASKGFLVWLMVGFVAGVLAVGTMIGGQYLLYSRGIFKPLELSGTGGGGNAASWIRLVGDVYLNAMPLRLFPQWSLPSLLIALGAIGYAIFSQSVSRKIFLLTYLAAPLFLLLLFARNDKHTLVGMATLLFLCTAFLLSRLSRSRVGMGFSAVFLIVFGLSQLSFLVAQREDHAHAYVVQQGTILQDQTEALDYIYLTAGDKAFSISSLTNPLGMNTTWAYLFSWYGQREYGRMPVWYGPTQQGIFGGETLRENTKPEALHFSIIEPVDGIPDHLVTKFLEDERVVIGEVEEARGFGTVRVLKRERMIGD